jgi:FKBP-type peptidyl-prolyl cis-trans isomerase 2
MRLISCALFALLIFSSTTCPAFAKRSGAAISDGKTVSIDYTMKVDGQVVDSTEQRGAVTYVQGQGQMMPGLEKGVYGLKPGDTKTVKVSPEEGYGEINPSAVVDVPRTQFPAEANIQPGMTMRAGTPDGGSRVIRIVDVNSNTVKVDMNHPLAGKTLDFDVKVISVK